MLIEVEDRDVGAFPGERNGNGSPDTAVTACDNGCFALELARSMMFAIF
jgi:hypothetical protein